MMWASYSELAQQASGTAGEYLREAVAKIDEELGFGYAKQHPELIGVFMRVSCDDYIAAASLKARDERGCE